MRTSLALICALALLASPYFFAYLEAERLLVWPDAMYRFLDPVAPPCDDFGDFADSHSPCHGLWVCSAITTTSEIDRLLLRRTSSGLASPPFGRYSTPLNPCPLVTLTGVCGPITAVSSERNQS